MLKNIKKHVLKAMYRYHYRMGNHYGFRSERGRKHLYRELELVNKLVYLEET